MLGFISLVKCHCMWSWRMWATTHNCHNHVFKCCIPYKTVLKSFHSKVVLICVYVAEMWGLKSFDCVENVHLSACRHFLNVILYYLILVNLLRCYNHPVVFSTGCAQWLYHRYVKLGYVLQLHYLVLFGV